jgi:membrane-bound lytic murein transglycosylase D
LPVGDGQQWESIIAGLPETLQRHKQKHSRIYTVRRGDTAGKVAKMHAVKLDDLIAANNLDHRATIYVNQNLRIPLPDEQPVLLADLKNPVQVARQASPPADDLTAAAVAGPEAPTTNEKAAEAVPEAGPGGNEPPTHPMAEFLLARGEVSDYGPETDRDSAEESEPTELAEDEPVSDSSAADNLQREQTDGENRPLNPEIMQGHFAVERVGMQNGKRVGRIRVEAEETLGHYAEWLNVSASDIRRLNGFQYGRPLQLSQKIKIPLNRVTKERFEEQRFEFHQELAEDFFATYRVEKILTYKIKKGDNIWKLARQEFEVPLWLISRYNNDVDFSALIPSQKLRIPIVEKNV